MLTITMGGLLAQRGDERNGPRHDEAGHQLVALVFGELGEVDVHGPVGKQNLRHTAQSLSG
ncbi:hypothetical protein J2X15_003170 [Rhodoferax saidenbachensis]|uniref:Uncharacterized protein n=1 Tax=Rhodoferax saidenbachensis TaxID=1484693 RepID=A0ABU1ZQN3_9BURK|nr:hypothetical protein [Rhodoferax saidenbachensis]